MADNPSSLQREREQVVELSRRMLDENLTNGTMGNVSVRKGDRFAMSPSGVPYSDVTPEKVPVVSVTNEKLEGTLKPSSETPMHAIFYRKREDVNCVVHTHSPYATTFATLDEPIPASHYLLAFAGRDVPVTEYAPPGTEKLGKLAVNTMEIDRNAVLLKNHGVITVGETPTDAFEVAQMLEYCARIHYQASAIGDPKILSDSQIGDLSDMFRNDYGQQ